MTVMRRMGLGGNAAVAAALALVLAMPGNLAGPHPGGDDEARSSAAPSTVLMVNVDTVTCLASMEDGTVVTGTMGGGVSEWGVDGHLRRVVTVADGLPGDYILDLEVHQGTLVGLVWNGSGVVELFQRVRDGDAWGYRTSDGGEHPLGGRLASDGDRLVATGVGGSILWTEDLSVWERPELPPGLPEEGWWDLDIDGDTLALTNKTGVVLLDVPTQNATTLSTPWVEDLAFDDGFLAIASFGHPDVYDTSTGDWLPAEVTQALKAIGEGWQHVEFRFGRLYAVNHRGVSVEVELGAGVGPEGIHELGGPEDWQGFTRDVLPLSLGMVLLGTENGTWAVSDGGASPFASEPVLQPRHSDILSVAEEGGSVWVLTKEGVQGLAFDSRGLPSTWIDGPSMVKIPANTLGPLDTAYHEGVIYIGGYGLGIHTYDAFASSKPNRWGRVHYSTGSQRDWIVGVEVARDTLYVASPYGLERLVHGSEPARFEDVRGSPEDIICLGTGEHLLLVGTEDGLWTYDLEDGTWTPPNRSLKWLPQEPIVDIAVVGGHQSFAVGDTLHWNPPVGPPASRVLSKGQDIASITARPVVPEPIWAVVNGTAHAYWPSEDRIVRWPGEGGLANTRVNEVSVSRDGTVYLATDSGLHRIGQFRTEWAQWTTSNGLSANDIRDLKVRPDTDHLWIGAYGGVDVMDTGTGEVHTIGTEDGLPSNLVYDIMFDRGEVWLGTDVGGVARRPLSGGDWEVLNTTDGLAANDVQALASTGDAILFGTDSGVTLWEFRGYHIFSSTHTRSSTNGELPDDWIWCALGGDGPLMAGTDKGLSRFNPNWPHKWGDTTIEGHEGKAVRALAYGAEDRLWVGTDDGLAVIERIPGSDEVPKATLDMSGGLPGSEVLSLFLDSEGMMWVGTSGGVAMVDMDMTVHATLTTRDGLVHDRVTSMAEHPDGTMWFGTAGGLSRLTKDRWDVMPQWSVAIQDLPDVYITLADVTPSPDEPNEGDEVEFGVTVRNPSALRAITNVALMTGDGGEPWEEIASAMAYTEPGKSYQVALCWTAVGGEQALWVVVDPDGLVPETNERNNVVAVSIHVNRGPVLSNASVEFSHFTHDTIFRGGRGFYDVNVTYRDPDGDPPVSIAAYHTDRSLSGELFRTVGSGNLVTGVTYWGTAEVLEGEDAVLIEADDGRLTANITLGITLAFELQISGLRDGMRLDGKETFEAHVVQPWGGNDYFLAEVELVEPGLNISEHDPLGPQPDMAVGGTAPEFHFDAGEVAEGRYDLWMLFEDDRGLLTYAVYEGVRVEHGEDGGVGQGLTVIMLLCVAAGITVAVLAGLYRLRKVGRGDP